MSPMQKKRTPHQDTRKAHILFVAAGYPAIGMGHIYRTLMLARGLEREDRRISYLLTNASDACAFNHIAAHYPVFQAPPRANLASAALALEPALVINDFLDTDAAYVAALTKAGIRVVNFEDEGTGAELADLVVNALYESRTGDGNARLYGHRYFCLRDEFLQAVPNAFRPDVRRVLITFGGTDVSDFTRKTLDSIFPLCREHAITMVIVAGPGYAHKNALEDYVHTLDPGRAHIYFTHATNVMSKEMENVELALCSAGRTVYELAHMRIPAIVLSHHEREDMHTFARPHNGFTYLGVMRDFRPGTVRDSFARLLDPGARRQLYDRLCRFDFSPNKPRVLSKISALLPS